MIVDVLDGLRARGMRTAFLWVLDGNEVAMSVYRRAGFMSTNHRQPLVARPGRTEERLYLNLALPPEAAHPTARQHPTSPCPRKDNPRRSFPRDQRSPPPTWVASARPGVAARAAQFVDLRDRVVRAARGSRLPGRAATRASRSRRPPDRDCSRAVRGSRPRGGPAAGRASRSRSASGIGLFPGCAWIAPARARPLPAPAGLVRLRDRDRNGSRTARGGAGRDGRHGRGGASPAG